jgi:ATP-binding cassette subfamily B protein
MLLAMTEGIHGITVTKVFGREREELARFEKKNLAVVDQQKDIFARASKFTAFVHFTSQINLAVLLGYGGLLVYRNDLSLGDLIVFRNVLSQFANQVSAMARVVNALQQSLAGARRVFEVLDTKVEIESPPGAVLVSSLPPEGAAIRFESVSFSYPNGHRALCDVSFEVSHGRCVGILGAAGSGKSTLLNLVARFYDTSAGRVVIDGHDVRELDVDSLRRSVGMVFQHTLLFKRSVADNIAFGRPSASRAEIERAAGVAGADEFIHGLPKGYDSPLAEGAANLSGGQRQRLALARAVLVEPRVLILDDPTTALDAQMESEVLGALRRVMRGRTTLIVANRLSTLRFADRVIVLERGQIVEQGTHRELMALGGAYYRTAKIQGVGEENGPALSLSEQWA